MDRSLTVNKLEKAEEFLDAYELDYTISDMHRLRSLLLREIDDRLRFWSHFFFNKEISVICCEYGDIEVHIMRSHKDRSDLTAETVSNGEDFHRVLSDNDRGPAFFV